MNVWLITGASRGLGREIARQALDRGDAVVATARQPQQVAQALRGYDDRLLAVPLDVTDPDQPAAAVQAAVERFGRIDILVNNAGRGLLGGVEEASSEEVQAVFQANVFGLLAVTRSVLPVMRAQKAGRILNISSVGGFAQAPGWGIYGATKFAVEGLSEALRAEAAPLGIQVVIIEPGSFRTDFLDGNSLHTTRRVIEDYAATAGHVRSQAAHRNHTQVNDPVKGAAAIVMIATADSPPARLQLGADSVAAVEAKLQQITEELNTWRELAVSTAYHDTASPEAAPGHRRSR
ncbi:MULTISPECIES: oxidoreductase [Streptomyces]|uniref:oxidoreductase n=1 Tax=Streptomyces lycopersici TaxID=2974589 RepID=UPI0021D1D942|nr:oxidoreductase [Streptomyces sp. NEAU-383]